MPERTEAPCPKCGRVYPAEWVTFSNGTKHLRVHCRTHSGVYAPHDAGARSQDAAKAPNERRLFEF